MERAGPHLLTPAPLQITSMGTRETLPNGTEMLFNYEEGWWGARGAGLATRPPTVSLLCLLWRKQLPPRMPRLPYPCAGGTYLRLPPPSS